MDLSIMHDLTYFLVAFFGTFVGCLAGLGGGLILKPIFNLLNDYPVDTIAFLSTLAVFFMSTTSIIMNRKKIKTLNTTLLYKIAFFSFVGGIIGGQLLDFSFKIFNSNNLLVFQSVLVELILISVLVVRRLDLSNLKKNLIPVWIIGLALGVVSSYLSIGGGPFNVLILTILFGFLQKEASIASTFIIFFSQLSVILKVTFLGQYSSYDLSMAPYIIVGAILAGLVGPRVLKKISNDFTGYIYNAVIAGVIIMNILVVFWNV